MEALPTHFPYLFAAYTAIWLVLFGYLVRLLRKERDLRAQLDTLVEELENQNLRTTGSAHQ